MRSFALLPVAAILTIPALARADVLLGSPPITRETPPSNTSDGAVDIPLPPQSAAPKPSQHLRWAEFASGKGSLLYGAAGTLLPLTKGGRDDALRVADSVLTASLATLALKSFIHEQRPDGSDYKSFPSEHSTAAFAIATMQAHFHPNQALLWYTGATAIAVSRVKLRRHRWRDVVAGAAIGVATSRIEIRQSRGLLLSPFIKGSGANRSSGLSLGGSF